LTCGWFQWGIQIDKEHEGAIAAEGQVPLSTREVLGSASGQLGIEVSCTLDVQAHAPQQASRSRMSLPPMLVNKPQEPAAVASGSTLGAAPVEWTCEDVGALKEELTVVAAERDSAQADLFQSAEFARSMIQKNDEQSKEIVTLRNQLKHSNMKCEELSQEASTLRNHVGESYRRVEVLEQECASLSAALEEAGGIISDLRLHNKLSNNLEMAEAKALRFASHAARKVLLGDKLAVGPADSGEVDCKGRESFKRLGMGSSIGSTAASGEQHSRSDTITSIWSDTASNCSDHVPRVGHRVSTSSSVVMPESIAESSASHGQSSAWHAATRSNSKQSSVQRSSPSSRTNSIASDLAPLLRGALTPRIPKELPPLRSSRRNSKRNSAQSGRLGSSTTAPLQAAAEAAARSPAASRSVELPPPTAMEGIAQSEATASNGNGAAGFKPGCGRHSARNSYF